MSKLKDILSKKILIGDGAMGTFIQELGDKKPSCNEELNLTDTNLIKKVHRLYLQAGSNIIETNTFGANKLNLSEYNLGKKTEEINKKAAKLARSQVDNLSSKKYRFVSGAIGPGNKLPSMGDITFDELVDSYFPQFLGLIKGGVDLFQIETSQDMLQAKAAFLQEKKL